MLQHEFEERIGRKVTEREYVEANAIYENAHNMDKDEFCADWKKHNGSKLVQLYFESYMSQRGMVDALMKKVQYLSTVIIKKAAEHGDEELNKIAINMIGEKAYIKKKIEFGIEMCDDDFALILDLIM